MPVPILEKADLQSAYLQHPELHFRLHFFEALNMVPVIGLILSLALLLWRSERRAGRRRGRWRCSSGSGAQPSAAGGPEDPVPAAAALARAARRASRSA